MTSAPVRLLLLGSLFAATGIGSFWVTRRSVDIAPGLHGVALGMVWLRHEYRLDDATFAKVAAAHHRYFRECAARCHERQDVNRHFLSVIQSRSAPPPDLDAVRLLHETICQDCRSAMRAHVQEVAALMPEPASSRFAADVQAILESSGTRRPRRPR